MSQGFGYVRIQFTKEDGSADSEMAKKAFEYCSENFDFFNDKNGNWRDYGDAFVLEESCGEIRSAYEGDGLYIDHDAADAMDDDWIMQIYDELKPYQMKVQLREDYSEISFDSNTIKRYKVCDVINRSGEVVDRKFELSDRFNFTNGEKYDCDNDYFKEDDDEYYNLIDEDGDEYYLIAKNKKTGRVIEVGSVSIRYEEDEDGETALHYAHLYDKDGEEIVFGDLSDAVSCEDFDIQDLVDEDKELGETTDPSDWGFFIESPAYQKFFYIEPTEK